MRSSGRVMACERHCSNCYVAVLCSLQISCSGGTLAAGTIPNVVLTDSGPAWIETTGNSGLEYGSRGNLVRWDRRTNKIHTVGSCNGSIAGLAASGDSVYMGCAESGSSALENVLVSDGFARDAVVLFAMDPAWNEPPASTSLDLPAVCAASSRSLLVANTASTGIWRVALDGSSTVERLNFGVGMDRCRILEMDQDTIFVFGSSILRVDPPTRDFVVEYTADASASYWVDHGTLFWWSPEGIWTHVIGQTTASMISVKIPSSDRYTRVWFGHIAADSTYVYWVVGFAAASDYYDAGRSGFIIRRTPISGGSEETLVDDSSQHVLQWLGVDSENLYWVDQDGLRYRRK
jgi:hypothetical protein